MNTITLLGMSVSGSIPKNLEPGFGSVPRNLGPSLGSVPGNRKPGASSTLGNLGTHIDLIQIERISTSRAFHIVAGM